MITYAQGDPKSGRAHLEKSLAIAREANSTVVLAHTLTRLGVVQAAQPEVAAPLMQEALAIARGGGDRVGTYFALHELAQLAYASGDFSGARNLHEEALILKRAQGDKWHIGFSLYWLAVLDRHDARTESATHHLQECLRIRQELGEPRGVVMCIEALSWLAADNRQWSRALRLMGAAESLRASMSAALPATQKAGHDGCTTILAQALSERRRAELMDRGRLMTFSQASRYALRSKTGRTRS